MHSLSRAGISCERLTQASQICVEMPVFIEPEVVQLALLIQDPTDPDSEYLIDALLDACQHAQAGGGAFAFLSRGGVRLFLKDSLFAGFMDHGKFDLVIGVDAITDTAAVAELTAVQAHHPSLGARVLIPTHPRSIFHPKFAWFDHGDGGVLLTGSGNLTAGGLRWNIEAFSVEVLNAKRMAAVRGDWDAFLGRTADCQFVPSDPKVVALLERNAARRKAMRQAGIVVPGEVEEEVAGAPPIGTPLVVPTVVETGIGQSDPVDEVPQIDDQATVLVAEIPSGGTRWEQANFSKDVFINFFGASMTVQRRAYFFHVRNDGTLGDQEVRPAVAVKSHNYRFELHAAKGLAYPKVGRPIGLFVRIGARTFLYMLLMPGSPGHAAMAKLLTSSKATGTGMRRVEYDASTVKKAWPTAPIWQQLTI
jgi:hypothetical protein